MKKRARARGNRDLVCEFLEERSLLAFDPGKAGAIIHESPGWSATAADNDLFVQNKRIGYMVGLTSEEPVLTSNSAADPMPVIGNARFRYTGDPVAVGTLSLKNSQARYMASGWYWDEATGTFKDTHTDGVYFKNSITAPGSSDSIFVFDNVDAQEIEGRQGFIFDGGSARRMYFRNTGVKNTYTHSSAVYSIKLADDDGTYATIHQLIFENSVGELNFVNNLPSNMRPSTVLKAVYLKNAGITAQQVKDKLKWNDPNDGNPNPVVDTQLQVFENTLPADLNFSRSALSIANVIQAENFNYGGEGLAYHDQTKANSGGNAARSDISADIPQVDIRSATTGGDGTPEVTAMQAGEWLDYTISVPESGTYELEAHVRPGATGAGGTFVVDFDGTYSTGTLTVSDTNVWQNPKGSVYLPAGMYAMRVAVIGATNNSIGWNMNWLRLTKTQSAQAISAPSNFKALAEPWGLIQTGEKSERPTEQWTGQVRLSWDKVPGADGYYVERSSDGVTWTNARVKTTLADGSLVDITNAATVTTFSDTGNYPGTTGQDNGIQPETTYLYRVTALSTMGNRMSDVVRVKTPAREITSVPAAATNVSAAIYPVSPTSGAIELTWKNAATNASGFWIERSDDGVNFVRLASVGPLAAAGGTNRFLDTDDQLAPNFSYQYRVIAYNWLGDSGLSDPSLSVTVPSNVTAVPADDEPTGVTAQALGNGAVKFTWTDNSTNEAGFIIQKAGQPIAAVEANITSYTYPSFSAATQSDLRIVAFNVQGSSNASSPVSAAPTTQPTPLVVPSNVEAFSLGGTTGKGIELWWDTVSDEVGQNVAEYVVERSIDGVGWTSVAGVTATQATRYRYVDRGLVANTTYFYRVRTSNKLGGLSRDANGNVIASPTARAGTGNFVPKQAGTPWATTNAIQAEDFDRGGQDVGFKDNVAGNSGSHAYRKKPDNSVDPLDADADIRLSGTDVWMDDLSTGEWAKYTVSVPRSGLYNVRLRVGSTGGGLKIDFDGEKLIQESIAAGTEGREVFLTVTNLVALNVGEHVVKIEGTSGSIDLDWFQLVERVGFYAQEREVRITGDAGANDFHVTRSGSVAKFSEGLTASASPLNIDVNSFGLVTFNGGSGADLLTLDMSGDDLISDGRRLDLKDDDLRVTGATIAEIDALVASARNPAGAAKWSGAGITSGTAASNPLTTLAAAANFGLATFAGRNVGQNDILVKYTYNGDADLNGLVNADDYFRIDAGFLEPPANPTYRDGDFNYDDKINADDYFLIDEAFLAQGAPLDGSGGGSLMAGDGGGGEGALVDGGGGGDSLLSESSQANLTIDLRVAGTGGKTAQVTTVGQVITIDVYATVTGDLATARQAFQSVQGAFTSTNVSLGAAKGTLTVVNESTFDASGASYGTQQDLDGDGDLDIGGTDPADADGYWTARAGAVRRSPTLTQSYTWKVATLTFTVTQLITGTGTTEVNFVKRQGAEEAALWMPDNLAQNLQDGTSAAFTVGTPVVLTR